MKTITVPHVEYEKVGNFVIGIRKTPYDAAKSTVIFIHGIGVSGRYFIPLAINLSSSHNIILLDLPGYGKTPKPPQALTISELAEVVHAFISTHNIQNSTIIGHSMGCQIATVLQSSYKASISNMILLAPTVYDKERSRLYQGWRLFQDTFSEPPKANSIIFSDYAKMGLLRYLKTTEFMLNNKIEDTLREVSVSTLIVRGTADRIVPHSWVTSLTTINEHLFHLNEISKAPHVLHFKKPSETARVCSQFINQF